MQMLQNINQPQRSTAPQPQQTSNKPQQQISCRICLEDMSPEQTFICCLCKEANAHVHEKCLTQWAKKVQKYRQSIDDYFYNCEICKDKIYLKVDKKFICLNYRQVRFFGQQFCCTIATLIILILGLGMFSVSLYLRLTSNQGLGYLFDIALGCAAVIILSDLIISALYFTVQTDIIVTGIIIKHYINKKPPIIKIPSHKSVTNLNNQKKKKENQANKTNNKKQQQNELNITEMIFLQNDSHVRQQLQILQETGLENQRIQDEGVDNNQQVRGSLAQLTVSNVILLKGQQNQLQLKKQQQQLPIQTTQSQPMAIENPLKTKQVHNNKLEIINYNNDLKSTKMGESLIDSTLKVQRKVQQQKNDNQVSNIFCEQQSKINLVESAIFIQGQKITQSSLTSVQQHTTNSIQVRSLLCRSRKSYETDLVEPQQQSLFFMDKNNLSSSNNKLSNDIDHNQIVSISKGVTVRNNNNVHKYRKTEPGYLLGIKKTTSMKIGENIKQQNQIENVQIYNPQIQQLNQ